MFNLAEPIYGEVPSHWQLLRLGELVKSGQADLQTGPFGTMLHASAYKSVGTPVVAVKHIGNNRLLHEADIPRVDEETHQKLSRYELRTGDILFGRKGAVERRALVTTKEDGWLQGSDCIRLRLLDPEIDPVYISYVLGSTAYRNWIVRHAQGATMPSLNQQILSLIPLPLPPADEQKAIAHILGTLDDKIELNQQMNQTLENIARALFKSWFIDFDPVRAKLDGRQPVGMDAETAALFPAEFEDSPLGKIPKGWRVSSLGRLFPNDKNCVITGPFGSNLHAHDYREKGVPLILVRHVNDGRIQEEDVPLVGEHKLSELARYQLETGDIIFTRVGAVGRTAYIYPKYSGWLISGQTLRVRISRAEILNSRYLAQVYLEPSFIQMVEGQALGTTRPSLNTKLLQAFQFLLPPVEIQNRFVQLIAPLDARVQNNLSEVATLSFTRDVLLQKLLSEGTSTKDAMQAL